MRHTATDS